MKKNNHEIIPGDHFMMDMPEVKDIPGQEHIIPPVIGEMADSTISSADEEGEGILDDLNKEQGEENMDNASNVSEGEKELLRQTDRPQTEETTDRKKLQLDQTDGQDPLNEKADLRDMGEDLDIPGSEMDDDNETIGEEDEENNNYSMPD